MPTPPRTCRRPGCGGGTHGHEPEPVRNAFAVTLWKNAAQIGNIVVAYEGRVGIGSAAVAVHLVVGHAVERQQAQVEQAIVVVIRRRTTPPAATTNHGS